MSNEKKIDPDMKGWLYKWTNYLKGYQKRWFVLSGGLLSYYRNQAEAQHTCRGNLSLHDAIIHTEDSCNFVISNGGTQTFHLKAASEVERQKWVTALELAKAKAVRILDSDDDEVEESSVDGGGSMGGGGPGNSGAGYPRDDSATNIKAFQSRLEDLRTCNDLIVKHATALHKSLAELEAVDASRDDLVSKMKTVNERATLFRISSNAMVNVSTSTELLRLASYNTAGLQMSARIICLVT
ncbi:Pleckstrin domain [Trinorchestia longiramus]|nr:Pleckstrin domain [Trinorchestia longiramus]